MSMQDQWFNGGSQLGGAPPELETPKPKQRAPKVPTQQRASSGSIFSPFLYAAHAVKGTGEAIWHHKVRSGAALVLWAAAASDRVPIPPENLKPPSPIEATTFLMDKTGDGFNGLRRGAIWIDHRLFNGGSDTTAATTAPSTPPTPAPGSTESPPPTPALAVEGATLPPLSDTGSTLAPEAASPPAATSLPPLPTVAATVAPPAVMTEELPNPMQYSAAAGSVVCNGEERSVYISPDGGAPLIQLFEQTGEPWNASSVGENPADQTLFNEVLNTKRNETAAGYDVLVRLGCIGLEQ